MYVLPPWMTSSIAYRRRRRRRDKMNSWISWWGIISIRYQPIYLQTFVSVSMYYCTDDNDAQSSCMQYTLCEMLWGALSSFLRNCGVHDPARDPPPGSRERERAAENVTVQTCIDSCNATRTCQVILTLPSMAFNQDQGDQIMYHTLFPKVSLQQKLNTEEDKYYFS